MATRKKFIDMSAVIAQAVKFAFLDARGKRAARELGLSLMQAKRLALGQVSESEERRVLAALRDKLNQQQAELARVRARIEERLNDTAAQSVGGALGVVVESHRLAAPDAGPRGAQGDEGAAR